LEKPNSFRKQFQIRNTIIADTNISTKKRDYLKDKILYRNIKYYLYKFISIQDSIQYLKYFYNLVSTEIQFSDNSINKNLAVVINTIKNLQYLYSIVAINNISIDIINTEILVIEQYLER